MAASIAENLNRIDSLNARMGDVLRSYIRLEKQQHSLPVQSRRDLSLPFARERFYLAAILEHKLGTLGFRATDDVLKTTEEPVLTGTIEIRPAWPGYFTDRIAFENERAEWSRAGAADAGFQRLEELVKNAESKARDVTTAMDRINTYPFRSTRPLGSILQTWTNFCMALYPNRTVDHALAATDLQAFHTTHESIFTAPGKRRWFIFNQFVGGILSNDTTPRVQFPHSSGGNVNPRARSFQPQASKESAPSQATHSSSNPASSGRFEEYNDHWEQLDPKAQIFYLPSYDLQLSGLRDTKHTTLPATRTQYWNDETVMTINAKVFFCKGCEVRFAILEDAKGKVTFGLATDEKENIRHLQRHLKLVETARWHPDRMNARTGRAGGIDPTLGNRDFVVAIRAAVQDLVEECERSLQ
ncbi:hypothetical protein Tdes44962_MAKER07092 [Teratosphaeria destructans]|uniref:Uncharacterized protein n=1 Tax=Teratosphaeria destructans TaxID=418781 RepID=A0A9W7SZW7_9PEZI|nr:hypothetical protein Tdes44962_MAKER07092 [Teratosphaeria destructans]